MNLNHLNITITDTQENNRAVSLENASVDSIKLVYNGQDDKFANIIPSELQFTLLVKDAEEGKFFHLFTGSETRYKVNLIDVSNVNYPKGIWSGFLLAEQYEEPYKERGYFVTFIATDRIALTKNITFTAGGTISVLKMIDNCLNLTGLDLPIFFSEAIQNTGFTIDYLDIEVNTDSYIAESNNTSYYDILEKLLLSIGCCLFLFEDKWYIIGLNKFKEKTISFKKYSRSELGVLQLDEACNITRDTIAPKFLANPTVGVLAPLKEVSVVWDADFQKELLPEDVVTHLPVDIDTDINDRTVKYWELTTNKSVTVQVWLILLDPDFDYTTIDFGSYYQGYKAVKDASLDDVNSGPYVYLNSVSSGTVTESDLATNYITLTDDVYIEGSSDLERFASLELDFFCPKNTSKTQQEVQDYFNIAGGITAVANNGSGKARITATGHGLTTDDYIEIKDTLVYDGAFIVTVIDANTFDIDIDFDNNRTGEFKILPFAKNFFYEITRRDHKTSTTVETVLTNFTTAGVPENKFGFDISFKDFDIIGSLKLDKILLEDSGFYNIKLYPQVTNALLGDYLIYKKCNLTLEIESDVNLTKSRSIDYTTKHDLELYHSSSTLNLSTRSFLFSDAFKQSLIDGDIIPGQLLVTPISYASEVQYLNGNPLYTEIKVALNKGDYLKLQGDYTLYVLKTGETELDEITADSYILSETSSGEYFLMQLVFTSSTFETIESTDVMYLKAEDVGVSLAYAEYWLDKWKLYDVEAALPMHGALVSLYHNLLHQYNITFSGTALTLISPLELIAFSFQGDRVFYPTNLELNLHQNTTDVFMVESKNENVTDYE